MMRTTIPVEEEDVLITIQGFLKRLLETGAVDAVLTPMETPSGAITPALVADPALLDAANPLTPVMGLNAARIVGPVSIREPRGRIAAVLRPCELRALVELVKLQQASLDDVIAIGIDCAGTYNVPTYLTKSKELVISDLWQTLYESLTTNPQSLIPDLRDACQICEKPHAEGAAITLELFGADLAAGIPISMPDEIAEKLDSPAPPLPRSPAPGEREATIERIVAARTSVRDARFAEIRMRLEKEGLAGVLAPCVRCHNCMAVCPICYCKTCLFKSAVMEHEPMQYMNWARRKGAARLPADTMLFHLTRLNHMALSCIGCGMCTSGCPADLPVGLVFRAIGQQAQAVFDYVPGRSVEEPLPLVTFKEDEWVEIGEE